MPEALREQTSRRLMRAGGTPWLRRNIGPGVVFHEHTELTRVEAVGDLLRLRTNSGATFEGDRSVLPRGFRFDGERIALLAPSVRAMIRASPRTVRPVLSRQMESTCPGLSFVGYPSDGTFGPLERFVQGTRFAGESRAAAILAN